MYHQPGKSNMTGVRKAYEKNRDVPTWEVENHSESGPVK
jgi:hypothetical protein